jgi:creatinine amidohydrolase/Fe(II)-dependent formamide hydrolase-like protein
MLDPLIAFSTALETQIIISKKALAIHYRRLHKYENRTLVESTHLVTVCPLFLELVNFSSTSTSCLSLCQYLRKALTRLRRSAFYKLVVVNVHRGRD